MKLIEQFFVFFRSLIYILISLIFKLKIARSSSATLIIRLDAIGDYVLFRNFLRSFNSNNKNNITLIGNEAWKDIALKYDNLYVKDFIWIDKKKFSRNLIYRFKKLNHINKYSYLELHAPAFSRDFYDTDCITLSVKSKLKRAFDGNLSNSTKKQRMIGNFFYTNLIKPDPKICFEFYRNMEFYEKVLNKNLRNVDLKLDKNNISKKDTAVLFIGASSKYRKWSIENFVAIGDFLQSNFNLEIFLCGSKEDINDAKTFEDLSKFSFHNCVGKTSLVELINIISKSKLILSNETVAHHIGVACNIKNIYVLYNGNHFGRFLPYPKTLNKNHRSILHPYIEKNKDLYMETCNSSDYISSLNINEITTKRVLNEIISTIDLS